MVHIVAIEFLDLNFGPHGNLVIKVIILLRKRCLKFPFFPPPIVLSHFCPVQNPVENDSRNSSRAEKWERCSRGPGALGTLESIRQMDEIDGKTPEQGTCHPRENVPTH